MRANFDYKLSILFCHCSYRGSPNEESAVYKTVDLENVLENNNIIPKEATTDYSNHEEFLFLNPLYAEVCKLIV